MMTILTGGFNHQVFLIRKNQRRCDFGEYWHPRPRPKKIQLTTDQLVGVSRIGTIDSHIVLVFF